MADFTIAERQPNDERPLSIASSSSSSASSLHGESSHDWVSRQMSLRRQEFVEKFDVKIKIVTWNVNGKRVAEDLDALLFEENEPGIYAIGLI